MALPIKKLNTSISSETVSLARKALADHLARIAEAEAEIAELRKPLNRLNAIDNELTAAEAELAQIEADHAAAYAAWAAKGEGPPPELGPEHETACRLVRTRQTQANAAESARDKYQAQIDAAQQHVAELSGGVQALVCAVLVEDATPLEERRCEHG